MNIFNDPATMIIGSIDKEYQKVPKTDLEIFSDIISETPSIKWYDIDMKKSSEIEKEMIEDIKALGEYVPEVIEDKSGKGFSKGKDQKKADAKAAAKAKK